MTALPPDLRELAARTVIWLAGNVDLWQPWALLALVGIVLGCAYLGWAALGSGR